MMQSVSQPTEKSLDHALTEALRNDEKFAGWFLSLTRFSGHSKCTVWSRSDHPWTKAEVSFFNPETGELETVVREGETDILAVFQRENGERFAVHIENKRGQGKFTPYQPDGYAARAKKWVGNADYGNYGEWCTVLVAPHSFALKYPSESGVFDAFISHEEIAEFLPLFLCLAENVKPIISAEIVSQSLNSNVS